MAELLFGAAGGRLASLLFLLCGALVAAVAALPLPDGASAPGLVVVGVVAMAVGAMLWRLPWERWSPRASLGIVVPPALALIAAHNWATGADGHRYGLFFLVLFAWVGLSHPAGTSLCLAPLLAAVYALPLLGHGLDGASLSSLAYAVPIATLIGETTAAVAGRLRSSEAAHRASEARWRSLVMNASDLILVINRDGVVEYATPAVERLFGYVQESTRGMQVFDLIHPDDLGFALERMALSIERPGAGEHIEVRVRRSDGSYTWVESIGTNLLDEPTVEGIVLNVRDIAERKEAELVLIHRARTDALTGLPNRHHLVDEATAHASSGGSFALFLLDLDGFKEVNDALGHETGDRVLVEVAARLASAVDPSQLVARLGGDEFAVIAAGVDSIIDASEVALALRAALERPVEVDGMMLHVGGSIGVALPVDGVGAADAVTIMLQRADVAMYRAKRDGLDVAVFGPEDELDRPARLTMAGDLRRALDADDVRAYFQPQVDAVTGAVRQVEALARWTRAGTPVAPDEFIPLAESTGLIRRLTVSVLGQALAQCRSWSDAGLHISVAVNVSAPTLRDPSFPPSVRDALLAAGVPASRLTLEITESALAEQTDSAIAVMHELRDMGIRLAIDDFGSGYSSMAYLKRLPIDELKIDRAFVTEMLTDTRDQPITRSIIELAHSLGLTVVAEGVESPAVEEILRGFGCDTLQGFGLFRPVPAEELTAWLGDRVPRRERPHLRAVEARVPAHGG